jgi:hypothetical protein
MQMPFLLPAWQRGLVKVVGVIGLEPTELFGS